MIKRPLLVHESRRQHLVKPTRSHTAYLPGGYADRPAETVIASMQPLMIYPRDEWKGMEGLWQQLAGDIAQGHVVMTMVNANIVYRLND